MNDPKFTPGPWEVNGDSIEIPDRFNDGMTATLAHIYDERDIALDSAEIQANARLIAAAPDLFHAARESAGGMQVLDIYLRYGAVIQQAEDALSKAVRP